MCIKKRRTSNLPIWSNRQGVNEFEGKNSSSCCSNTLHLLLNQQCVRRDLVHFICSSIIGSLLNEDHQIFEWIMIKLFDSSIHYVDRSFSIHALVRVFYYLMIKSSVAYSMNWLKKKENEKNLVRWMIEREMSWNLI